MISRVLTALDNWITAALLSGRLRPPARWVKFAALYYPDARVRKHFLREVGVVLGDGSFTNPGFKVVTDPGEASPQVLIGERVSIGPNCVAICDSRPNNSPVLTSIPYVRDRLIRKAPIVIENDVWIGASVTILPGVRIGHSSVVGAGAVVISDVEPFHVVAGVPARTLRVLSHG